MNNWDWVKATILATAGFGAFSLGMSVAFLIVGLIQRVKDRKRGPWESSMAKFS